MDILKNLGISYKASYLVQGNQMERCNTSTSLNVENTELQVRTDGKDFNINNILKSYKGNIVLHLPPVNPDLSNLELVNDVVKKIKDSKIKLVTINASNLALNLFEWSTLEEQKKYFLNIVTSVATIASNKIEVAFENLNPKANEVMFGSNINQMTDIIVYTRRLLTKDFGFTEEEAEKYVGITLDVNNVNTDAEKDNILNWFEVFNESIKVIKFQTIEQLRMIYDILKDKEYNGYIFYETKSDLDDIKNEYSDLETYLIEELKKKGVEIKPKKTKKIKKDNKGFSNIMITTMIVLTIVIVILMFIVKLR
ncbi:MAG: hypothetical protein J6O62_02560 [Bacilli bacterium]|nr:hypothetical protein [Bacilli bacterium]MBO6195546.1 hypothetical protein [Bacilli bacterium]